MKIVQSLSLERSYTISCRYFRVSIVVYIMKYDIKLLTMYLDLYIFHCVGTFMCVCVCLLSYIFDHYRYFLDIYHGYSWLPWNYNMVSISSTMVTRRPSSTHLSFTLERHDINIVGHLDVNEVFFFFFCFVLLVLGWDVQIVIIRKLLIK